MKVPVLNDSRLIGICLYNIGILSAVGLGVTLLLDDDIVLTYAVISVCVIIGTTLTQTIIFVPKVIVELFRTTWASSSKTVPLSMGKTGGIT